MNVRYYIILADWAELMIDHRQGKAYNGTFNPDPQRQVNADEQHSRTISQTSERLFPSRNYTLRSRSSRPAGELGRP